MVSTLQLGMVSFDSLFLACCVYPFTHCSEEGEAFVSSLVPFQWQEAQEALGGGEIIGKIHEV